ncbi:MAG: hypothetical protein Q9183_006736, partial [Haloplaca sp. 2 TL-2023]
MKRRKNLHLLVRECRDCCRYLWRSANECTTGPEPLAGNNETPLNESHQPPPATLNPSDVANRGGEVESGVIPEAEEASSKEVSAEKAEKQAVDETQEESYSTGLRASSCPSPRRHADSDADPANRGGEEHSATLTHGEAESGVAPAAEEGSSNNASAEEKVVDERKKEPSSTGPRASPCPSHHWHADSDADSLNRDSEEQSNVQPEKGELQHEATPTNDQTVHEQEESYTSGPQPSQHTSRGATEDDAIFLDDDETQSNVQSNTQMASTEGNSAESQNVNAEEEEPYTSGPIESSKPSKPRNWMDEDAEFLDLPDIVEAPAPAPGSGDTAYSMDSMFSALQDIENEPRPGLMEPLQPQPAQPLQQEPTASIDHPVTRSNEVNDQHMDDAAVPSQESQPATRDAQLQPATNTQRMYSDMELSHLFKNTNPQSDQHTAMELDDADQ